MSARHCEWYGFAEELLADNETEVCIIDHRGVGFSVEDDFDDSDAESTASGGAIARSRCWWRTWSMDGFARDVLDVVRFGAGWKSFHLMGLSLGGLIAQQAALLVATEFDDSLKIESLSLITTTGKINIGFTARGLLPLFYNGWRLWGSGATSRQKKGDQREKPGTRGVFDRSDENPADKPANGAPPVPEMPRRSSENEEELQTRLRYLETLYYDGYLKRSCVFSLDELAGWDNGGERKNGVVQENQLHFSRPLFIRQLRDVLLGMVNRKKKEYVDEKVLELLDKKQGEDRKANPNAEEKQQEGVALQQQKFSWSSVMTTLAFLMSRGRVVDDEILELLGLQDAKSAFASPFAQLFDGVKAGQGRATADSDARPESVKAAVFFKFTREDWAKIRRKVGTICVLGAEHDRILPIAASQDLAVNLDADFFVRFENSAHMLFDEQRTVTTTVLRNVLSRDPQSEASIPGEGLKSLRVRLCRARTGVRAGGTPAAMERTKAGLLRTWLEQGASEVSLLADKSAIFDLDVANIVISTKGHHHRNSASLLKRTQAKL
eukprot:g11386.t1